MYIEHASLLDHVHCTALFFSSVPWPPYSSLYSMFSSYSAVFLFSAVSTGNVVQVRALQVACHWNTRSPILQTNTSSLTFRDTTRETLMSHSSSVPTRLPPMR